jgi:hypothetical protein
MRRRDNNKIEKGIFGVGLGRVENIFYGPL